VNVVPRRCQRPPGSRGPGRGAGDWVTYLSAGTGRTGEAGRFPGSWGGALMPPPTSAVRNRPRDSVVMHSPSLTVTVTRHWQVPAGPADGELVLTGLDGPGPVAGSQRSPDAASTA